jgi:hypothetical protein
MAAASSDSLGRVTTVASESAEAAGSGAEQALRPSVTASAQVAATAGLVGFIDRISLTADSRVNLLTANAHKYVNSGPNEREQMQALLYRPAATARRAAPSPDRRVRDLGRRDAALDRSLRAVN